MLDALFSGLAALLALFYDVVPDYGIAIVLFTLAIMLVLSPLTLKQTRSMLAMQRIQPEIKKLQQQHKGDRQALNEAQMALFKEHGVNPLAGCLPMLLQAPVFSVLYWVLQGLTHEAKGAKARQLCGEAVKVCIDPKYLNKDTELYQSLRAGGGRMMSFGVDLAQKATEPHGSFLSALPYYVLVVLAAGASYFQMQRMYARNPSALANNPQAAMMNRIFPLMTGVISLTLPAGIALYFVVSNLFRVAQQEAMYRWDPHVSTHAKAVARNASSRMDRGEDATSALSHAEDDVEEDEHRGRRGGSGKDAAKGDGGPQAQKPQPLGTPKGQSKTENKTRGGGPGSSSNGKAAANGRAQPKGSRGRKRRGGRRR